MGFYYPADHDALLLSLSHVTHQVVTGAQLLDDLAVVERLGGPRPRPRQLGGHWRLTWRPEMRERRLRRLMTRILQRLRPETCQDDQSWIWRLVLAASEELTKYARHQVSLYTVKKYETGKKVL